MMNVNITVRAWAVFLIGTICGASLAGNFIGYHLPHHLAWCQMISGGRQ